MPDPRFVPDTPVDNRFVPDDPIDHPKFVPDQPESTVKNQVLNTNPVQEPSMLGKAWDWANTSLTGMKDPSMEELMGPNAKSASWRKGVVGMTTPLALGGEALGGLGLVKGISKYFGKAGQAASEIAPEASPEISNTSKFGQDVLASQPINQESDILSSIPKKPRLRINLDKTITNLDTGEIINPNKGPIQSQIISSQTPIPKSTKLAKDLQGAKPRFNIGYNSYQPQFESHVDKALYIIAQKIPSKRDADYLKFVMDQTGLDENSARQIGSIIRSKIKNTVAGQEPGPINIPTIWKPTPTTSAELPKFGNQVLNSQPLEAGQPITPQFNPKGKTGLTGNAQKPPITPDQPIDLSSSKSNKSTISDALNVPRALQASMDISAPLRQGLPLVTTKAWWIAWPDMIKSYGSEDAYQSVIDSIKEHPNFKPMINPVNGKELPSYAEQSGLKLTTLGSLGNREEALMSNLAEKVPGVRPSNRAYTAYLNKLRSDTFNSLVDDATQSGQSPKNNQVLSKEIANFINNATGRGNLGSLEKHAVLLNNIFFSPRLIASRVQMMNPANYISTSPLVRKQYLKALVSTAGAWTTFAGLAKLGGASVSLDSNSADFGKIRIGDTRIDPAGGFQQYLVATSRLISGKQTNSTTGRDYTLGSRYGLPTRKDVVENFAANKLNPVLKFAYDALNATKQAPFDIKSKVAELFIPMMVQDVYDVAKEDPKLLPITIPAGAAGMGVQTYGRNSN